MQKVNFLRLTWLFCISTLAIALLPYYIYGEDSYITYHDNLDQIPAFFGQSKFYGLFAIDVPSGTLDNTSSLYFGWGGFSIVNMLYYLLPHYEAYLSIITLSIIIGFIGMLMLQNKIFNGQYKIVQLITSLFYSLSATLPAWSIAVAFIPFLIYTFLKVYDKEEKYSKWIVSFLIFPFFSEFNSVAIYVCIFLFIACFIISLRKKNIAYRLLFIFLLYSVGVVIFHFKLFYMQFAVAEDLNRAHFTTTPEFSLMAFTQTTYNYIVTGFYHSSTQTGLISKIIFLYIITTILFSKGLKLKNVSYRYGLYCIIGICFLSLIATMDEYEFFQTIKNAIPALKGFSFVRLYVFNRVLWYIAIGYFAIDVIQEYAKLRIIKPILYIIALLQTIYILTNNCPYNDSLRNIYYHFHETDNLTWREFYDTELFDRIKKDINYNHEAVAELGFHPMILILNGFNSIGGYLSYYPYKDMLKYRRLIEPELLINEEAKKYYDSWGGRRYLYNSQIDFTPTRKKHPEPVLLNINSEVFKRDFEGKYIISRAPISNTEILGLTLKGKWDSKEGIYTMYVYETI